MTKKAKFPKTFSGNKMLNQKTYMSKAFKSRPKSMAINLSADGIVLKNFMPDITSKHAMKALETTQKYENVLQNFSTLHCGSLLFALQLYLPPACWIL